MKKLLVIAALAASACASVPMARKDLDLRAKQLEAPKDAARLYVYRSNTLTGTAVSLGVWLDDARVGILGPGTFLTLTVRPGEHAIVVRTQDEARQTLRVEAGRNYYVRAEAAWGWRRTGASLELVADERAGAEAVRGCSLAASLAAEQLRRVAAGLSEAAVDSVPAEALLREAIGALATMVGQAPETVTELDEAVDRLRAARPGMTDGDVVAAGTRAMLLALEPAREKAARDPSRSVSVATGLVVRARGSGITIAAVLPDSPAALGRVEAGTEIVEVDGRPMRDHAADEAVRLLDGMPGSEVALALKRPGEQDRKVLLRRAPADASAVDCRVLGDRVLYLRPWLVTPAAARRVRDDARAVPAAAPLVVLDLRDAQAGNIGGGVELADSFMATGTILSLEGGRANGVNRVYTAAPGTSPLEEARVVVLVNGRTGVAAEGTASALQDARRATVLGSTTLGAGVAYTWVDVAGMRLHVPTARLVRANGQYVADRGVVPDVVPGSAVGHAATPVRDVACPGVTSPGAVEDDDLVATAVQMLIEAAEKKSAPRASAR